MLLRRRAGGVCVILAALMCRGSADEASEDGGGPRILGDFELPDSMTKFELEFVSHDEPGLPELLQNGYEPHPLQIKSSYLEGYQCYVSATKKDKAPAEGSTQSEEKAGPEDNEAQSIEGMLQPLGSQCLYRLEMYWSYEYCHGKHVRQYHEDVITTAGGKKTKKLTEHFLGYAGSDTRPPQAKVPQKFTYNGKPTLYHSELLGNGDICDLTNSPRTTEVRFVCNPDVLHAFESISETSTCNYLVIIQTSMVCDHSDFTAETQITRKTLCVSDPGSPRQPHKLTQQEETLATEEAAREAQTAAAKRLAEKQQTQQRQQRAQQQQNQQEATQRRGNRVVGDQKNTGANAGAGVGPNHNTKASEQAARQLLLRFFSGKQCFVGGQGWWQHEFCYMKHVKQIHTNEDGSRIEIFLGKWDREYHVQRLAQAGGMKAKSSFTHYYGEGNFCDEIGKNREIRVKMMCSMSLKGTQVALSLHETQTCKYTLKVQSALFCKIMKNVDEYGFPQL